MAELQNNLLVLEYVARHPGEPQTSLPGDLRWVQLPIFSSHAVWDAAQQNGVVRLMSPVEANSQQTFYQWLTTLTDQSNVTWNAISDARRFAIQDPDPTHLSEQQLYETIQLTEIAIQKHLQVGYSIAFINGRFPGLPATLSYEEIRTYLSSAYERDRQGMGPAHQRTMDRLKAAGYVPQDDDVAFPKGGGR